MWLDCFNVTDSSGSFYLLTAASVSDFLLVTLSLANQLATTLTLGCRPVPSLTLSLSRYSVVVEQRFSLGEGEQGN
ncbi:hypothetical protein INR49_011289 [Caranx melampygus]|nr:hypothetical protein INR49_011289 [Caranx melampygus]